MIKIVSIAALAVAVSSCASIDTLLDKTKSTGAMTDTTTSINAEKGLVTLQSNQTTNRPLIDHNCPLTSQATSQFCPIVPGLSELAGCQNCAS